MSQTPTLTVETPDPGVIAPFYAALGFIEVDRDTDRIELDRGGLRLSLLGGSAHHSPSGGGFELTMQVDDLDAMRAALLAAGGSEYDGGRSAWSGTLLLDPVGNRIRLLAPAVATPTPSSAATPSAPDAEGSTSGPPTAPTAPSPPPSTSPAKATPQASASSTLAAGASALWNAADAAIDRLPTPQSSLPADYYSEDGVPTFDAVAERIHKQAATADGDAVLDAESPRGRDEAQDLDRLKQAGKDRLDQLRKGFGRPGSS
ncbi:VOC family protein [Cumulibacter soli]|uniref:VOC family protein n=1 Tax=Cumulibacter soli TaxID=2546344 RepID=UPI00141A0C6B|nr:VOC family protein [Cumulibacter soli]